MIHDSRSHNAYRVAILAIVLIMLPVAMLGFRYLFLRLTKRSIALTSSPAYAVMAIPSPPLPDAAVSVHRTKAGLEVTVSAENPTGTAISSYSLSELEVEGTPLIKTPEPWGTLPSHGRTKKTYRISNTFSGKKKAMVRYTFKVKFGSTSSGTEAPIQ